ncbi:FKBP-type peptidyl-prolyl cis-trans isomerase [uncultured Arcticibacterium sp.]|uniref:FKBP-type peptidyl-prolyl cis-trans isomerase n=1 Tax=uncultured Arcticibacterium sp. TaxID=2173042 RepID=UPI0030FCE170
MTMSKITSFIVLLFSVFMLSCDKDGFSGSEDSQIQQYIESKNIVITEKTDSGLVYILTEENLDGESLERGQIVGVNYTGRLLNDKEFDSGSFSFQLGVGRVVKGFDEGIAKMRVGEKATIIFPSSLGYGNQKQGSIPKNSPLVFDVEVVGAK